MKLQLAMAATAAAFAAFADATPAATSNEVKYKLDTSPSPRVLKTLDEVTSLWEATYDAGVTVTRSTPDTGTLVDAATAEGTVALGINAGGLWTFNNSNEGDATFAVSHSIYGTLGAGTVSDPAKIVYATELFDLGVGAGYCYTWVGTSGAAATVPAGFKATESNGVWTLAADPNAIVSTWVSYWLDTLQDGPNRTIDKRRGHAIAYTGDDWAFGDSSSTATSTLAIAYPNGTTTSDSLVGTDAQAFVANGKGRHAVTLTESNGTVLTATITFEPHSGFAVFLR